MWDSWLQISGPALTVVSAMLGTSYGWSRYAEKVRRRHTEYMAAFGRLPGSSQETTVPGSGDLWRPSPRTSREWQPSRRSVIPGALASPPPYREPEDDTEAGALDLILRWSSNFLDRSLDPIERPIKSAWGMLRPLRWLRYLLIVPVGLACLAYFLALVALIAIIFPFKVMFDDDKDWRLRLIALTLPVGAVFDLLGFL